MIGPLISPVPRAWKRAKKHLAPMVEERLRQEALYGKDWAERPVRDSLWSVTSIDNLY